MPAFAGEVPPAPQPPEAVKVLALDVLKNLVETNATHTSTSARGCDYERTMPCSVKYTRGVHETWVTENDPQQSVASDCFAASS